METDLLYVARQPIFDSAGKVWGCKLLYRESEEAGAARYLDGEEATLKVAAGLLISPDHGYGDAYTMVTVTRDFLLQSMVQGMEAPKLVVGVRASLLKDEAACKTLGDLKAQGYMVSLDLAGELWKNVDHPELFDVVEIPWPELRLNPRPEGWEGVKLLVKRIETHEQADRAQAEGADLLQGFYFEKPRTYQVRSLSSTALSRLKILQILEDQDENFEQVVQAMESDVSLALRLLRLVNSASFALARRIESVRQAANLVGWNKLRNWLRLIVVTDMAPSRTTNELAYASAVRAKFLELAAEYTGREEMAEKLYMLGLFSLLEAMLETGFSEIFKELQLNEEIKVALLDGLGPLGGWLSLARLMDSGNWLSLDAAAAELDLSMKDIARCRLEAFDWAKGVFQSLG